MKKRLPFLALAVGVGSMVCAAAETTNLSASATQFVRLLVKEDFTNAVARFDQTMKAALPEAKLREVWEGLQQQVGPFKKELRSRIEKLGGYDIVLVTCEYEHATLDTKVVFDGQKQVAGLFFVPTPAPAGPYQAPPYARTNDFRETAFTVGTGEWALPGTLTMPLNAAKPCAAVVLVAGSGPHDRDETIFANKPFRDLAWGLATKGIAVLRYEKRTKEYAAKIAAAGLAGFTVKEESIDDAVTAARQLRKTPNIDPKRIFVLGHSLGGTVAPRIGLAEPDLAGLILLAGSVRPLEDLMVEQTRYLLESEGKLTEEGEAKLHQVEAEVAKVKKLTPADATSSVPLFNAPPSYWLDLRAHDPRTAAQGLKRPVLVLQGGRDYQVTLVDFDGWKQALASRHDVTFRLYPNLNHLFIAGDGKSTPAEYERAGHVAEAVVTDIADWIGAN